MESGFMVDDNLEIAKLFAALIQRMVDLPEEVTVEAIRHENRLVLHCIVSPKDLGKVIGKQGRTAKSLRIILSAVAATDDLEYGLDIESHTSSLRT
jgi:predicted RNA-binding protein YlqC (UPF0109 family)